MDRAELEVARDEVRRLQDKCRLFADFSDWAHECMAEGRESEALETLQRMRGMFGDLFSLRMQIDDAIKALGGGA